VTAPVVGLLVFSTVYCRYHYVVDVIGGIGLAMLTFLIGDAAYGYWEERKHTDRRG
jgi:membrane-associated phospholipid phosphatase